MKDPHPLAELLNRRGLEISFVLILLCTAVFKIPSLSLPHEEFDERIYVALAKQVYHEGVYTLRGTELLKELAPEMYDRPFFYQPPLYVLLSIPLVIHFGDRSAVLLSWAGHFMVLFALYFFMKRLAKNVPLAILLVLSLAATDPILVFTSRKIWLDGLAAGFCALSIYLFWSGCLEEEGRRKTRRLLFSGILLGATVITKVPAVLLGPFYALLHFQCHGKLSLNKQARLLGTVLFPALVIVFPWFLMTFIHYGVLIDTPILPEKLIRSNPYIRMVINRPPGFYLRETALIAPILVFVLLRCLWRPARLSFFTITLWVTFFSVIGGYTAFAVIYHQAYVMRYLALFGLPLYLLVGLFLAGALEKKAEDFAPASEAHPSFGLLFRYTLGFMALCANAMTNLFYAEHFYSDELFSLFDVFKGIH